MQSPISRVAILIGCIASIAVASGCDPVTTVEQVQTGDLSPQAVVAPVEPESPSIVDSDRISKTETPVSPPEAAAQSPATDTYTAEPSPETTTADDGAQTGPSKLSLRMLAWNVESEGAVSSVISQELAAMGGYDIYGLTEVMPEDIRIYKEALGEEYKFVFSATGYNDRMQLIYNDRKLELIQKLDLDEINYKRRYRSPLVAHLRDRNTNIEFMVMVNHLARGKAEVRTKQAEQLVEWARGKEMPLIGLGDYNFDFVFATETGNEGFNAMLRDNIWKWVRPTELIDTNWYDPEPDGVDNYPGSMLDFAFVAGKATEWNSICNVIVREGDFPDDEKTSDHRPYELIVTE